MKTVFARVITALVMIAGFTPAYGLEVKVNILQRNVMWRILPLLI